MAEEHPENDQKSLIDLSEENLFELRCLIKASGIIHSARCEVGRRQLLAFTTRRTDVGIYYHSDIHQLPVIKRIPWYRAPSRGISALCFDPTGTWLLAASADGSLHILPALALVDDSQVVDHKWSTKDVTPIPIIDLQSSYSRPTALTWWQGVTQSSHIGVVGTEDGEVIFVNLENGQWIGSTRVRGSISSLDICQDNNLEIVSLLITNRTRQQWRLVLEQRANGCIFSLHKSSPFHSRIETEETKPFPTRSRLQGLKQLSVEKLASLKQKLAESRNKNPGSSVFRQDSGSSSGAEDSDPSGRRDTLVTPELLSEDTYLSPQYTRQGQHLYTAYCEGTNHITIHGTDVSVIPLHMYKMPEICTDILLTQRLFFTTGPRRRTLWMISCPLSEVRINNSEDSHFNPESVISRFQFDDGREVITHVFRASDYKSTTDDQQSSKDDKKKILPCKIDDLNIEVPPVDTCVVVTNCGIYKIVLRRPLLTVFIELALKNNKRDIEKAARLGLVFGINVPQLFECAGDIHLANSRFTEAAALYKLSRCRLLKGVLKTAATGHTEKLLGCLGHCLTPPAVTELTTTTRIHLSNLTVFAFSELVLRASPSEATGIYKDFLLFLSRNTYYDERWVVDVVGQTCLWKVLHHLASQRGLYAQVLDVLIKAVQSYPLSPTSPLNSKYGLMICISEPSLLQSMLSTPALARSHMSFVLSNLQDFQVFVLQRLVTLYDPTNPIFRPLLVKYRARRRTTSHSSQSSQCDSLDSSDILDETGSLVEELIETFLYVLLTLISKRSPVLKHNPSLVAKINHPGVEKRHNVVTNVNFKRRLLAAGYGHVALIRNGNVFTWGSSSQGCLGTGPSISRYGSPQAITVFKTMEMEVLSVSCGRNHTLAVTNNGVYAWGGSQYGQLGLGRVLQCPSPELIISLAQEVIVDAVAGQYHSVALTMDGRVFTWGWGVHGQLGHGNTNERNVPTLVEALLGIVIRTVAAGHAHTLLLSDDGVVYAFGCNIFGQLGTGNTTKSTVPIRVSLLPDPISDIATSYFHNLALTTSNKLHTWGASPQVLRLQTQAQKKSKLLEFQAAAKKYAESLVDFDPSVESGDEEPSGDISSIEKLAMKTVNERRQNCPNVAKIVVSLRDINLGLLEETQVHLKPSPVDTQLVNGRIVQISTGCHHSALLTKDGTVYTWGRNLDGQIGNRTRKDVAIPTPLTYNAVSILAQVPPRNNSKHRAQDNEEDANMNDTRGDMMHLGTATLRVCCGCEFTVAIQPGGGVLAWGSNSLAQLGRPPSKESGGSVAEKLVLIKSSKRVVRLPHGAHVAQDSPSLVPHIPTPIITYQSYDVTPLAGRVRPLSLVERSYGDLTLHYALEQFSGIYDAGKIMEKCDELENYQARSKLALLEHNYSISLAYQLKTLNPDNYKTASMSSVDDRIVVNRVSVADEKVRENTELFVKQIEQNIVDSLEESETKKRVKMSTSKSLDCIQLIEQELHTFDCQGGSEELCEDAKSEDNVSLDLTEGALDNDEEVNHSKDRLNGDLTNGGLHSGEEYSEPSDLMTTDALKIIKFYIREIDETAHKIMRQVLQTTFDFWIKNKLDVEVLEDLLLENMKKLFYPLGLLLFCSHEVDSSTPRVIDHVSAKFSLQVSSLILRHIDEGKPSLEYIEMFSMLMDRSYDPPINGYLSSKESKTPGEMMEDIISTISSKSSDPRPFIHIRDPEDVAQFLESDEDTIVFTCGHHFSMSIYQSEVLPNMEAELLVAQPLPLPCTAQVLGNMLSRVCKTDILCPRCVPRAIQTAAKTVMER
ncbi:uncharacterized protein LOC107044705 [Diachasma alloeum]|uniref:uncharacterized protein LOC107044705 n=1 Tax=Diachasma alloeum TaxID=454923 RepID=UPI0007384144|nr:uncharacterized protein LOC107044705 [Diachasma alloeum]XP_015122189.1 uncharacterized protein LOC107044705 [Diachasma alloeum]